MSELSVADQIFYILLLGCLILASVGGVLYFISDILERKQEIKDFNLNQSYYRGKGIYEYHPNCYCKHCRANRKNKSRTSHIRLN